MTRMSPEVLGNVAAAAGGAFIDGTGQPDLGLREVESKIGGLEKRDLEGRVRRLFINCSAIPALLALLALLAALVLPERASSSGVNGINGGRA